MITKNSLAGENKMNIIQFPVSHRVFTYFSAKLILQGLWLTGFLFLDYVRNFVNRHITKNTFTKFQGVIKAAYRLCKQIEHSPKWILAIIATWFLLNGCVQPALAQQAQIDLSAIERIESNFNPSAVSNKNAVGNFQITSIALRDFNIQTQSKVKLSDLKNNPALGYHIAYWLLEVRAPQMLKGRDSVRNRLITYNCGISCVDKKLPLETKNYLKKYKKITGEKLWA
jgi:hypothetical protein